MILCVSNKDLYKCRKDLIDMIQDYRNLFSLEGKHALVTGGARDWDCPLPRPSARQAPW